MYTLVSARVRKTASIVDIKPVGPDQTVFLVSEEREFKLVADLGSRTRLCLKFKFKDLVFNGKLEI